MAEREGHEETFGQKTPFRRKVFLILGVLLLLSALGVFGNVKFMNLVETEGKMSGEQNHNLKGKQLKVLDLMPLKPFVINLNGANVSRYMKVGVVLSLWNRSLERKIQKNCPTYEIPLSCFSQRRHMMR